MGKPRKRLVNIRIERLPDGKLRMHYGDSRGYLTLENKDEARAKVLPWIVSRMGELSRDIDELSDVMAFLVKDLEAR